MIVDSHAHYSSTKFDGDFSCLAMGPEGAALLQMDRDRLLRELKNQGITAVVEPAISLESNREVFDLCGRWPELLHPAVGVHPTRTAAAAWRDRKELDAFSQDTRAAAIGEIGLDFHQPRQEQHRLVQLRWFCYQLRLAHKRRLPVILHVRNADRQVLRVLRLHRRLLHGGVAHCFSGDWPTAREYLSLGLHLGIGGALLQKPPKFQLLREAVEKIPLNRILVETDAPYVLPYLGGVCSKKEARGVRNCSLILPEVIRTIAEIKGVEPHIVEEITCRNAKELFRLQ